MAPLNCSVWRSYVTLETVNDTHLSTYRTYSIVVSGFILSALITLGVVGNLLIIVVLKRPKLRNYLSPYFIGLAMWDCLLMLAFFPCFSLIPAMKAFHYDGYDHQYQLLQIYIYPLAHIFRTLSTWTLVALSIERYYGICRPLQNCRQHNNRPYYYSALVCLVGIGFSIPRFFEISLCEDTLVPSPLRHDPLYHLVYNVIFSLSLTELGPSLLLWILTFLITKSLKQSNSFRLHNSHKRSTSESKCSSLPVTVSRMLIAASVKFLLCTSLSTSLDICESATSVEFVESEMFAYLVDMSNLLIGLNSALNFPIYFVTGGRFRTEVNKMFRVMAKPQQQQLCHFSAQPIISI